mmetsp:Transcript_28090/g.68404  ORF Transcript_28090/g.68404 Transcript_28090/m.68404 type:complete len:110 (-) Transcript_28090:1474-1803(-)
MPFLRTVFECSLRVNRPKAKEVKKPDIISFDKLLKPQLSAPSISNIKASRIFCLERETKFAASFVFLFPTQAMLDDMLQPFKRDNMDTPLRCLLYFRARRSFMTYQVCV